jgi:hypothetical protein
MEEGRHWCTLCRVVDLDFNVRRYKMGWIKHRRQEMFRNADDLELMWGHFEPPPLFGLPCDTGSIFMYCVAPNNWTPTYLQNTTWCWSSIIYSISFH